MGSFGCASPHRRISALLREQKPSTDLDFVEFLAQVMPNIIAPSATSQLAFLSVSGSGLLWGVLHYWNLRADQFARAALPRAREVWAQSAPARQGLLDYARWAWQHALLAVFWLCCQAREASQEVVQAARRSAEWVRRREPVVLRLATRRCLDQARRCSRVPRRRPPSDPMAVAAAAAGSSFCHVPSQTAWEWACTS